MSICWWAWRHTNPKLSENLHWEKRTYDKHKGNVADFGSLRVYWGAGSSTDYTKEATKSRSGGMPFYFWGGQNCDNARIWRSKPKSWRLNRKIIMERFEDVVQTYQKNGWTDIIEFVAEEIANGTRIQIRFGRDKTRFGSFEEDVIAPILSKIDRATRRILDEHNHLAEQREYSPTLFSPASISLGSFNSIPDDPRPTLGRDYPIERAQKKTTHSSDLFSIPIAHREMEHGRKSRNAKSNSPKISGREVFSRVGKRLDAIFEHVENISAGVDALMDSAADSDIRLSTLENSVASLEIGNIAQIATDVSALSDRVSSGFAKSDLLLMDIAACRGEEPADVQKRIFATAAPAIGKIRTKQQAVLKMLGAFDGICQLLGVEYWLGYGALLGSVWRDSMIPWDAGIEVCLMRADVERLASYLRKANDSGAKSRLGFGYQVSTVYDYHNLCVQRRFSLTVPDCPVFVELSVFDATRTCAEDADMVARVVRIDAERRLEELTENGALSYWKEHPYIPAVNDISWTKQDEPVNWYDLDMSECARCADIIESVFTASRIDLADLGVETSDDLSLPDVSQKTATIAGVAYGTDNPGEPERPALWKRDIILPICRGVLDGIDVSLPADAAALCEICYPGSPYLPDDMCASSRRKRRSTDESNSMIEAYEAIRRYANAK